MIQVILGLFLLAFGLWGVFDSWNYILDFFNGVAPLIMIVVGILSISLYLIGPENLKKFNKEEDA
ncbi:MAG: hypothetical protein HQK51_12090 [Oligoflexia bacterium]|nr:hypothetical protein [Oligoflexia bacterium]